MRASIAHLQRIKVGKALKCLDHGINIRPMENKSLYKPSDGPSDEPT